MDSLRDKNEHMTQTLTMLSSGDHNIALSGSSEDAWIEVIQQMDRVYKELIAS